MKTAQRRADLSKQRKIPDDKNHLDPTVPEARTGVTVWDCCCLIYYVEFIELDSGLYTDR